MPIEHLGRTEKIGEGKASEVLQFDRSDKKYICKVMKENGFAFEHYKGTIEEKIVSMQKAFVFLKRYLGDYLVDTYFDIGKRSDGAPCILIFQEKVEGTPYAQLAEEQKPELRRQKEEIGRITQKAWMDPEICNFPFDVQKDLRGEATVEDNIIVDREGKLRVIDW